MNAEIETLEKALTTAIEKAKTTSDDKAYNAAGLPVYGTCAGLILLAKKIDGEPSQRIASMDITALRNAYGRQLGSFYIEAPMKGIEGNIPMTFIRAPYIKEVWGDAGFLWLAGGQSVFSGRTV